MRYVSFAFCLRYRLEIMQELTHLKFVKIRANFALNWDEMAESLIGFNADNIGNHGPILGWMVAKIRSIRHGWGNARNTEKSLKGFSQTHFPEKYHQTIDKAIEIISQTVIRSLRTKKPITMVMILSSIRNQLSKDKSYRRKIEAFSSYQLSGIRDNIKSDKMVKSNHTQTTIKILAGYIPTSKKQKLFCKVFQACQEYGKIQTLRELGISESYLNKILRNPPMELVSLYNGIALLVD